MLHIAVNCRFACAGMVTGVERYAHNVLENLIEQCAVRNHKVTLIAPASAFASLQKFTTHAHVEMKQTWNPTSALLRHLWEQTTLPYIASQIGADALVNLVNTCPVLFPRNIITVHDMAWLTESKSLSKVFSLGYSAIIPIGLRGALQVITVSEWSRAEILKHVDIADKLSVILEGVSPDFRPASKAAVHAKLAQLGIDQPYLLTVGTIQPRKNLPRLIEAFNLACQSHDQSPLLVVAGGRGKHFASTEFEELQQKNKANVRFLGYVPEADLPLLYSGALAYLSASLYEGFGLTPLEAMACQTAVAVSDLPPHREVAGDAALFFDATNASEMSSTIKRLINDTELRTALIEKGTARLSLFSWQAHASKLVEIIERTAATRFG